MAGARGTGVFGFFLLGRDFVWRCRHVWARCLTGARGTGVFGRDVWTGFAAGARGTVERGCVDRGGRQKGRGSAIHSVILCETRKEVQNVT